MVTSLGQWSYPVSERQKKPSRKLSACQEPPLPLGWTLVYSVAMSKMLVFLISLAVLVTAVFSLTRFHRTPAAPSNTNASVNSVVNTSTNTAPANATVTPSVTNAASAPPTTTNVNSTPVVNTPTPAAPIVVVPMADFFNRITKKPFGIYITPKTSPVQPEKFQGYHTGADAETTSAEKNTDIPIHTLAAGKVVLARYVSGYGGVMMIQSTVDGQVITALYGHVRQSSIRFTVGQSVKLGQQIAVLGTGYSSETDGERKHLHLGILKGASTNVKGYVNSASQLSAWLDPVVWLKAHDVQ